MRFPRNHPGVEPFLSNRRTANSRIGSSAQERECAMRTLIARGISTTGFFVIFAGCGLAAPMSSPLLSLVPSGAEIVAGFQNRTNSNAHGRLLLTTHNNRRDLEDWQSLTGVDSSRVFDEVVEAAASDAAGNLSEHLLLVAGRFDHERISRSLEENGASSTKFQGQRVLIIKPLARERGDMLDDRWFLILDNRIGMFGTPGIVQRALERYADHAVPDSVLEERLSLLRPDVTSWNVLSRSPKIAYPFTFAEPHSAWAELQHDTDLLMIGARFGSKVRIDFSLHSRSERNEEFFSRKASFFTNTMVAGPDREPMAQAALQRQVEQFSIGANHVQGSVELSSKQFEAWCEQISRIQLPSGVLATGGN